MPPGLNLAEDEQSFTYHYDKLNRLITAGYANANTTSKFDEELGYDVMGNITSLKRKNSATSHSNDLAYDYGTGATLGNQLYGVADTGTEGYNSTYTYDANGNQKTNSKLDITNIEYNYLNLPKAITKSATGEVLGYTYDATGRKLRKQLGAQVTDYVGGIQYTNGLIDFIQTEEGRALPNGSSYTYEYFLKDHLGNTRAVIKEDGSIVQVQDYYAFGREMDAGNQYADSPVNKYTYNGKEKQSELGLDQLDYGARFYDPVIGRWIVTDPLSEVSRRFSPYSYGLNNPIRFIDVDGMYAAPPDDIFINTETKQLSVIKTSDNFDRIIVDGTYTGNKDKGATKAQLEGSYSINELQINYSKDANKSTVSDYSTSVIVNAMNGSGNTSIQINSTARTPEDQARAMSQNVVGSSLSDQKALYGPNGKAILEKYPDQKAMVDKINEIGPSKVSNHMVDTKVMNVVDVSVRNGGIKNPRNFADVAAKTLGVSKVLSPYNSKEPAIHIEIPQKRPK